MTPAMDKDSKPLIDPALTSASGSAPFRCPKCGSAKWGTSHCTEPFAKWIGHCHGLGCKFTWHRATQDGDVFALNAERSNREKET